MANRHSLIASVGLLAMLAAGCGGGGGGSPSPSPVPTPVDTTPDTITFTGQSTMPSTAVTSATVTITGINSAAAISITGGEYSISGGAFTSAASTVSNGQTVAVRVTASPQFSTAASATVTVGGASATFTVTTVDADPTPNAYQFQNSVNTARGILVASNSVTITGLNTSSPVTITGGEYSIAGGAFTSAAGTVTNNQTIQVRVTSSAQFSTPASTTLTIGGVAATFTATTYAPDSTPDAFQFQAASNVVRTTQVSSNEITIAGINTGSPVTITGGQYSIEGGAFTAAAGTVNDGQHIRVRLTSSNLFSTAASAVLTVGGVPGTFTATTYAEDTTPDQFQFQKVTNAVVGGLMFSNTIPIQGINNTTPVTITGGEYSVAGGAYRTTAGTIEPGQSITVRSRASATYSKTTRATVTIGGVSAEFVVEAQLPVFTPEDVEFDGSIVYLLNGANRMIFRWSLSEARYLDPFELSQSLPVPTLMTYSSAHQRMYIGYGSTGAIRYINPSLASPTEQTFATLANGVYSMGNAGNFLAVQSGQYGYGGGQVLNSSGVVTDSGGYYYGYSRATAWDPNYSTLYYFRDGISPNDLQFDVINQVSGDVAVQGETPYHGSYSIQGPIRVSANGQHILLGSGDIYRHSDLNWVGSIGSQIADARWLANGSLVTLVTSGNQTTLRRLNSGNLSILEQLTYTGQALRVIGTDDKMAVVVLNGGALQINAYVPSDDSDGDGVSNTQDAFPLDRAASVDTDQDGYPDSWNTGYSQADSTTGLTLDSFPQDAACWLASHGSGGICDYSATLPSYRPDQIVQQGDIVYLLSIVNKRVYRWSISTGQYLNPYVVGINQGYTTLAPSKIAVSAAHQRLYLGYSTGAIRYIDLAGSSAAEVPFANIAMAVNGLASVGNYVLAQDYSGAWATHYVINSAGTITDWAEWNHYSPDYAWDPNTSRVYWFSMWSPPDLNYEVINQTTGEITSTGETPYHGVYSIIPPIRVSANGQYILLGSGDIYDSNGLTWSGSVGAQFTDSRWFADGSLLTLSTANNQTVLRRLSGTSRVVLEQLPYTGEALRVVGSDTRMAVVLINNNTVQFQIYTPSDDSDGDGVLNTQDAFPLDRAASVDSDGDGYPDAWNAGRTQADSTTGLVLDSFPNDSACWLASHGSGGVCNYGATIPNYLPDQVVQVGDVIYLLSSANGRVYRRSISGGQYLNPFVVTLNQGFGAISPTVMAYVPVHGRLYLGYANGTIRYIDLNGSSSAMVPFASLPAAVMSLGSGGNYVVAKAQGGYDSSYVLNSAGGVTSHGGSYDGYSRELAWDATNNRVYYTNYYSLQYDVINQTNGLVTSHVEMPYQGSRPVGGVIRLSSNGQYILLGVGDFYRPADLMWAGTLGTQVADARWFADGTLATLTSSGNQTLVRRLSGTNLTTLEQRTFAGAALRVVGTDTAMVVLVNDGVTVQFYNYVPTNDSDGDGVLNTLDAFPLDVAASVDTDRDGYPDAWNAGRSQADSTTGLVLDTFPNDSACWLPAHGSGGVCNYGATIPNYTPDQVVQNGDVIYLLSNANRRVYRRSISTGAYLNPYVVGIDQGFTTVAPTKIAYSAAHHRLYLGYDTGTIRYIDVNAASLVEQPFANMGGAMLGLTSAGNFLAAHIRDNYSYNGTYVLNSSGVTTDTGGGYFYYASEYAWDPVSSRIYQTSTGYSSYALYYEVIDQTTGEITSNGNSVYNGSTISAPPVRVSQDGLHILIGSGDVYARNTMAWEGQIGTQVTDARWFADGTIGTLVTTGNQTTLRRLSSTNLSILEQRTFTGQALRLVGSDTLMSVVVLNNNTVQFYNYVPNNDSDGDGVLNTADAFPLDVAASVDTDGDGYPDSWNAGRTQADSTTGLSLDAFPTEAACWLAAHGSGGVCNYGATIPDYTPDAVAQRGDVVYLLSGANRRVYRWSIATGAYLSPYVVGSNQGYSTLPPISMMYSVAHQRVYLGYSTGQIRYIDVTAGTPAEVPFTTMQVGVAGLADAGNFLVAQINSGGSYSANILSSAGAVTDQLSNYYGYSPQQTAWDAGSSRFYYFGYSYLRYDVIDQTTGEVSSSAEAPYYSGSSASGAIRPSLDGSQILVAGSGDVFARTGLNRTGSVGKALTDAQWKDNLLITLDTTDLVEIRDANSRVVLQSYQYLGTPRRLLIGTSEVYLMHTMNNATTFVRLAFYDTDGDGMPRWWEQLYAGLSDTSAADATTDLDSDGVNNLAEYQNHSNPLVSDTDGDGLTDSQEIVTYHTDPSRTDTDGDGLSDYAEVITHHSDPLDTDSDDDTYPDLIEVLYGGNPTDGSVLPQPLYNYSQTFEGTPNLAAWSSPPQIGGPWTIDTTAAHAGSASYKSGAIGPSQTSSVKFRGFFRPGTLSFYARVDSTYCCNRMYVLVDGVQSAYLSGGYSTGVWNPVSLQISLGIHDIEWRFEKDYYGGPNADAAWIDDIVFTGQ